MITRHRSTEPAGALSLARTVLRQDGEGVAWVTDPESLALDIPGPILRLHWLEGGWGRETQPRTGPPAPLVLESLSGRTGFAFQPWLVLEGVGEAWVVELLWSGNWRLAVEPAGQGVRVRAGLHPQGLRHGLAAGERLALPEVLFGRVRGGLGEAVRALHDARRAMRPNPARPVPVQFNSWFPFPGAPDSTEMLAVVPQAARLGCEVFVLDAGWFATCEDREPEEWWAAVGDWRVNPCAFPHGLAPLAAACRAAGMGFGLWFEPEAVGAVAPLRRRHPEWMHHPGGAAPAPQSRAVLHLGIAEARDYIFAAMAALIRRTGAVWLKWDFNMDLAAGWAPGTPPALARQDALVAHVHGVYALQDALRAEFPQLTLEMCASGGGRLDGAVLAHAHTYWISDRAQALAKLAIHRGSQRAHPAVACNDWLVDWPDGAAPLEGGEADGRSDLAFRLRVAMLGSFGISAAISRWSAADRQLAAAHVQLYREHVRPLVQFGDMFEPPAPAGWLAWHYQAKDAARGVVFAFRLQSAVASWVFRGVEIAIPADYRSAVVLLEEGKEALLF